MAEISLWKRVGGWLRRSQGAAGRGESVGVDAEGLLVAPALDEAVEAERVATLTRPRKKDELTMEEGFGRLVEVLESINENVSEHRRQDGELKEYLAELADSLRVVPDAVGRQEEAAKQLNEELRSQAVRQQQLVELMGNLPELNEAQVEKLEEIRRQLGDAAEGEARMAEVLAQNSDIQAKAVREMAAAVQENATQLQAMVAKQNMRLLWVGLLGLVIVGGAVAAIVLLLMRGAG